MGGFNELLIIGYREKCTEKKGFLVVDSMTESG